MCAVPTPTIVICPAAFTVATPAASVDQSTSFVASTGVPSVNLATHWSWNAAAPVWNTSGPPGLIVSVCTTGTFGSAYAPVIVPANNVAAVAAAGAGSKMTD